MELDTLISTERPKLDINDKYLPDGSYSLKIQHFGDGGNVTGIIEGTIYDKEDELGKLKAKHIKEKYTFRYYSIIQMMARAQSQLARRATTVSVKRIESLDFSNVPSYPSPSNSPGIMKNIIIENSESSEEGSPIITRTKYCVSPSFLPIDGPPVESIREKRKIKNKKSKKKKSISQCMICLDEHNLDKTLECGHKFHYHCIFKWYSECERTCPICRLEINELADRI